MGQQTVVASPQIDRAAAQEIVALEVASGASQAAASDGGIDQDHVAIALRFVAGPERIAAAVGVTMSGKASPVTLDSGNQTRSGQTAAPVTHHVHGKDVVELLAVVGRSLIEAVDVNRATAATGEQGDAARGPRPETRTGRGRRVGCWRRRRTHRRG